VFLPFEEDMVPAFALINNCREKVEMPAGSWWSEVAGAEIRKEEGALAQGCPTCEAEVFEVSVPAKLRRLLRPVRFFSVL